MMARSVQRVPFLADAYWLTDAGVEVLGLVTLVLSLLDELSDAFLAIRAAIIAGQPANDTSTGRAMSQPLIFTSWFTVFSPNRWIHPHRMS